MPIAAELTDAFGASLALDRDGVLWVGTTRGLVAIGANGKARRYDAAEGVPAAPVRAVLVDRDGTLWIGTPNGLARREGDRFVRVSAPGLRAGVSVWDLFEDRDGSLWVGTSSGLHRFREQQFTDVRDARGTPKRSADGSLRGSSGHVVDRVSGRRRPRRERVGAKARLACSGLAEQRGVLHPWHA